MDDLKTNKFYSALIALLLVAFASPVFSQARLQVIHNSADEAAADWLMFG
ncbi:MAG: hypothetical protein MZV64_50425 [Ignavibacteriales bacterium]|nr:hypothetical protein [Ignavibacteriales bacterium]